MSALGPLLALPCVTRGDVVKVSPTHFPIYHQSPFPCASEVGRWGQWPFLGSQFSFQTIASSYKKSWSFKRWSFEWTVLHPPCLIKTLDPVGLLTFFFTRSPAIIPGDASTLVYQFHALASCFLFVVLPACTWLIVASMHLPPLDSAATLSCSTSKILSQNIYQYVVLCNKLLPNLEA